MPPAMANQFKQRGVPPFLWPPLLIRSLIIWNITSVCLSENKRQFKVLCQGVGVRTIKHTTSTTDWNIIVVWVLTPLDLWSNLMCLFSDNLLTFTDPTSDKGQKKLGPHSHKITHKIGQRQLSQNPLKSLWSEDHKYPNKLPNIA